MTRHQLLQIRDTTNRHCELIWGIMLTFKITLDCVRNIYIDDIMSNGIIFFYINAEIQQMMSSEGKRLCYAKIRALHGWIDRIFFLDSRILVSDQCKLYPWSGLSKRPDKNDSMNHEQGLASLTSFCIAVLSSFWNKPQIALDKLLLCSLEGVLPFSEFCSAFLQYL